MAVRIGDGHGAMRPMTTFMVDLPFNVSCDVTILSSFLLIFASSLLVPDTSHIASCMY